MIRDLVKLGQDTNFGVNFPRVLGGIGEIGVFWSLGRSKLLLVFGLGRGGAWLRYSGS